MLDKSYQDSPEYSESPNDGSILYGTDGKPFLNGGSPEGAQNILGTLIDLSETVKLNHAEGHLCGMCAAFPCFRTMAARAVLEDGNYWKQFPGAFERQTERAIREAQKDGGWCFQASRQCRPECIHFNENEGSGIAPKFQITGVCKKDGSPNNHGAPCHIAGEQKQKPYSLDPRK